MPKNKPEYWDLMDANLNYIRTIQKGGIDIPQGLYHVGVEVVPTDKQGHMLVTLRSMAKRRGGGKYEFPAGSVLAGEAYERAAIRELREETGLTPNKLYLLQRKRTEGLIRFTYLAYIPDLLNRKITLQPGETSGYKYVTIKEWHQMLVTGAFSPERKKMYAPEFFSVLEKMVGVAEPEPEEQPKPLQLRKTAGLRSSLRSATANDNFETESSYGKNAEEPPVELGDDGA